MGGVTNTLIYFPKCCSPIPGDDIIGYITRGKGVTIHRSNCTNVPITKEKERFIDVFENHPLTYSWSDGVKKMIALKLFDEVMKDS